MFCLNLSNYVCFSLLTYECKSIKHTFFFLPKNDPGFWMVSTSEDDVKDLQSYESNESEIEEEDEEEEESDAGKSENDLEIMEILGQIETQQHIQTDSRLVAQDNSKAIASGSSEGKVS